MAILATIRNIGVCAGRPHRTLCAVGGTIERLATAVLVTMALTATMTVSALAQNRTNADQDGGTMRWDDGSFRAGDTVRLEPHIRFQTDMLLRDQSAAVDDRIDWPRHRASIEGELFTRVEFQVERELERETAWRDVYGDIKINRALRVRAGRFKIPFSTEQTTGGFNLDFLNRPAGVEAMSPDRDLGVMVHGRPVDRFKYEVGVFRHSDGFALPFDDHRLGLVAGRVAFAPVRNAKNGLTRDLELGVAVARNAVPEGLNGVVGHFVNGDRFFEHMYVKGARTRLGVNGLWAAGRLTLKGELLQLTDERVQQSITGEDLSSLVTRGAYIGGIWRVYGKHGRKKMAVDIEARFERMTFGSVDQTDEPFTNPRAEHVAPLSQHTWTFGATWIVNRWVKVQGNAIREDLIDPLGVRSLAPTPPVTALARLQFGL